MISSYQNNWILPGYFFENICIDIAGVHCATKAEVDQHLQMGMQLIAKGQYSDALSHFHSAIGKNLSGYQNSRGKFK